MALTQLFGEPLDHSGHSHLWEQIQHIVLAMAVAAPVLTGIPGHCVFFMSWRSPGSISLTIYFFKVRYTQSEGASERCELSIKLQHETEIRDFESLGNRSSPAHS